MKKIYITLIALISLVAQPVFATGTLSVFAEAAQFVSDSPACSKVYPSSTGYAETVIRCLDGGGSGQWVIPATFPPDAPLDWDLRVNYRAEAATGSCRWVVSVVVEHDTGDLNYEATAGININTPSRAHSLTTTYYSTLATNLVGFYENDTPAICLTNGCTQDRPIKINVLYDDANSTIDCDFRSLDIFY